MQACRESGGKSFLVLAVDKGVSFISYLMISVLYYMAFKNYMKIMKGRM